MSAMLSYIRAGFYGIGVFVAATASLCIALSIAIAGPPTNEELAGVRNLTDAAMRELEKAISGAGAETCESLPREIGEVLLCPAPLAVETAEVAEKPSPLPSSTPVEVAAPEPVEVTTLSAPAPDLLGGPSHTARVRPPTQVRRTTARPPAAHRAAPARRANRAAPVRRQASARPPHRPAPAPAVIEARSLPAIERLPEDAEEARLIDMNPPTEAELREEARPAQREAPSRSNATDEELEDDYAYPEDAYAEPEPDEYWRPRSWR